MSTKDGKPVGSLYDDLSSVAERVHRITGEHPVLVWADDAGAVRAVAPGAEAFVSHGNIAGFFDNSASLQHIEEDLAALLHARTKGAILSE